MAAKLSGKPQKKGQGGNSGEETAAPAAEAKAPKQNVLLIVALTVALLLAGLSTAGLLYLALSPKSGVLPAPEQHAAEKEQEFQPGPMLVLGSFTVNLGDISERRFLRTAVALSFTTSDPKYKSEKKEEKEAFVKELTEEIEQKKPVFQDIVIITLSAKTVESLGSAQGKMELKAELTTRLNQYFGKETYLQDVFLTEFIIQ